MLGSTNQMIRKGTIKISDVFTDLDLDHIEKYKGDGKLVTYKFPPVQLDYDSIFIR